jgi:phosphonate transport system permease protein
MTEALYIIPSKKFKQKATLFSVLSVLVLGTCIYLEFNPILFFTDFHYIVSLIGEMLPPNFSILWSNKSIWYSILQTVSMAFLGTLIGGCIAVFLAFFAASNTTPSPALRLIIRTLLSIERVIPSLIVVLVFVIAVGLGAFAGMLTLIVGTVGMFGKLFSEAIETTENAPAEAIYSVGASKLQVIRYAIIPQVLPSFIANFLYAMDINMRAAIGLGIFGGGGIGFELHMAMRMLRYQDALPLILFTIVLVIAVEKLSDYLRRRILGEGKLV